MVEREAWDAFWEYDEAASFRAGVPRQNAWFDPLSVISNINLKGPNEIIVEARVTAFIWEYISSDHERIYIALWGPTDPEGQEEGGLDLDCISAICQSPLIDGEWHHTQCTQIRPV